MLLARGFLIFLLEFKLRHLEEFHLRKVNIVSWDMWVIAFWSIPLYSNRICIWINTSQTLNCIWLVFESFQCDFLKLLLVLLHFFEVFYILQFYSFLFFFHSLLHFLSDILLIYEFVIFFRINVKIRIFIFILDFLLRFLFFRFRNFFILATHFNIFSRFIRIRLSFWLLTFGFNSWLHIYLKLLHSFFHGFQSLWHDYVTFLCSHISKDLALSIQPFLL